MAYVKAPITITYKTSAKARKVRKKTFRNTHMDAIIERLEKNKIPGFTERTVIIHIGWGSAFL
jgi:hypothetical protein